MTDIESTERSFDGYAGLVGVRTALDRDSFGNHISIARFSIGICNMTATLGG